MVDYGEYDLARLSLLFGGILPLSLPIQIQLVPGSGGAANNGSNTIWCYCDTSTDPLGLPSLVVAEEAEIFLIAPVSCRKRRRVAHSISGFAA